MTNELAVRREMNLDKLQRTASMLVASGYFDAKGDRNTQIAQLATKIMAGRELGYGPFASVQGIHVIQGKPQVSANLMAAAVKAHPRYDYKVRKMTDSVVEIEFFENGASIGKSEFTDEQAKAAQLTGKSVWKQFPRNMLFARALSNGVRWFCPDVFNGNAVYVEGEIDGNEEPSVVVVDSDTGEIVEGVTEVTTDGAGIVDSLDNVAEVAMISKIQLRALHATGYDMYGKEWDAKRPQLVKAATKSRGDFSSANDLTQEEADKLINGMRERMAGRNYDAEHSDEQLDNPFDDEAQPEPA